jgi:hypothetical protein
MLQNIEISQYTRTKYDENLNKINMTLNSIQTNRKLQLRLNKLKKNLMNNH